MFPRHLSQILLNRYQTARSVYLFGPQQSGKTTLAQLTFPELPYVSLEDPDQLEFATLDPRGFFAAFKTGAIIDEPQRCPDLFSYLQGEIDQHHKKFILTSSQNFLTLSSISQSLAARISLLNLWPLSKREIHYESLFELETLFLDSANPTLPKHQVFKDLTTFWDLILKGGYPEIHASPKSFDYWHRDYVKTYLERDVRRMIHVQDLMLFQRFIKLCAGRTGNLLNKSALASDCGISETQCTRWLSLLEQSGIIILLKPYYSNFNKRLIKTPKLSFFIDTGLCCYLLGIRTTEHLSNHPLVGSIFETFVITELYKTILNQGQDPQFYFWRDQHGHEIDLLIEQANGQLCPIEIKMTQTIYQTVYRSLQKWRTLANCSTGVVIYGGTAHQVRDGIQMIPIGAL